MNSSVIVQTPDNANVREGWHDLAVDIILTAVEDARAGDPEARHSLQRGGFCYRLAGYLDAQPEHLLEDLGRA